MKKKLFEKSFQKKFSDFPISYCTHKFHIKIKSKNLKLNCQNLYLSNYVNYNIYVWMIMKWGGGEFYIIHHYFNSCGTTIRLM